MPLDSTPRSFALPSLVPSGITAPGLATATVCPAATLGAPQTICDGVEPPMSTMQTLRRSASGWRLRSSTLPTTKFSQRADAVVLDALDLGPGHRQALGERVDVEVGLAVLVEPFERDALITNCSRKRTSLS